MKYTLLILVGLSLTSMAHAKKKVQTWGPEERTHFIPTAEDNRKREIMKETCTAAYNVKDTAMMLEREKIGNPNAIPPGPNKGLIKEAQDRHDYCKDRFSQWEKVYVDAFKKPFDYGKCVVFGYQ